MRCLGFLATSFLLAACPGSGGGDDDGLQPDGPPGDGPPIGTGGLVLRIATDRAIPAEIEGDLRISDIRLGGMSIRAIGDAASAGDPRTTKADVDLHWDNDDAPDAISFDEAPSGRYSTIKIDVAKIDSEHGALEIEGEVKIDGDFEPFEVDSDDADFVVMIGIGEVLEPGATKTIQLDMEVDKLLGNIDFQNVPLDNGVHVIDDDRPAELGMIIAALTTAFKHDSSGD